MGNAYLDKTEEIYSERSIRLQAIRHTHLRRESALRAFGIAIALIGFTMTSCVVLATIARTASMRDARVDASSTEQEEPKIEPTALAVIYAVTAALGCWFMLGGYTLQSFGATGKWAAYTFMGLLVLSFPIGTIAYLVLWSAVFGGNSERLFTEEYREAIRETPFISCKFSMLARSLLGLLSAMVVFVLLAWAQEIMGSGK